MQPRFQKCCRPLTSHKLVGQQPIGKLHAIREFMYLNIFVKAINEFLGEIFPVHNENREETWIRFSCFPQLHRKLMVAIDFFR